MQKAAKRVVVDLAKHSVFSLSKEIVPLVVHQTMSELNLLKTIPNEPETSNVGNFLSDDLITMEAACNEDIFVDKAILRLH